MEKKKLNILMINYEYPPIGGGGGVICKDFAEQFVSLGHHVTIITSYFNGLPRNEIINGVEINRVPVLMRNKKNVASLQSMLSYVPSSALKVKSLLKSRKFDLIHTHFAIPSGPVGDYFSRAYGIPNVLSIYGGDIYDPSKRLSPHKTFGLKQIVSKMMNNADKVIAESNDIKNNAEKFYNINREIDIIPLGIKPYPSLKTTRSELGFHSNEHIYITIGRLVKRKNLTELIGIFHKLNKNNPGRLLIIGDGPEKGNIEETVSKFKLENNVKFLGRVSDEEKYRYLSISDLYLSTALHEGFGLVFLEAMECFLPIVCYDHGGQTDFLKDEVTGYLVKLGDADTFVCKVRNLMSSSKLREKIGNHNKLYVKKYYISSCADQYISIFEVLSK